MRIPFSEIGMQCVFSSEWDKNAALVYESNFGELPAGDISQINESTIPGHDLLLAGFPCQPFSHAGLKRGFDDTRGTLFFDVARITAYHRPKVLLLENVRGLLAHDKGKTFSRILEILTNLDYVCHWDVLNAKDFGLPQNRARVFIVAIREDQPLAVNYRFPVGDCRPTKVGQILETSPPETLTISDQLWSGHQRRKQGHQARGNGFGYSVVDASSPTTRTLSARYFKDGSEILVHQEGQNPRKLSVREAARLQGFPEEFVPSPQKTHAYKQFGNSVSIPVVRAIRESLADILNYPG